MIALGRAALIASLSALLILPASANLVTNPGFETGNTSGWTTWAASWSSGYSATAQKIYKYSGTYALKLGITGIASFGVYQQVTVTPGASYKLNGMWKATTASFGWFEVLLIDGAFSIDEADKAGVCNKNIIAGYDSTLGWPPPGAFGWEPFSASYRIPNGIRTATGNVMTVVLKMGGNTASKPTSYFDDVTLEHVPEPGSAIALSGGIGLLGIFRGRRP